MRKKFEKKILYVCLLSIDLCLYVVIYLIIASGGTMVPISWTEMQCPLTGQIEQRKVAKVD